MTLPVLLRQNSEPERVRALQQLGVLNTNTSDYFDSVTALAKTLFDVSGAYISLLDSDRQWIKSAVGYCPPNTDRDKTFCQYTIAQASVLVIEDTLRDPRFAGNPLVAGPQGVRFYAGAPLVTQDGYAIGALCLIDQRTRALPASDQQRLATLAGLVMAHITLGRAVGHVDAVSGMPNKYQLADDLGAAAALAPGAQRVLVDLAMPDAARAFEIIRVMGAAVHDQLVREVGARLQQLCAGRAQVYHLGDTRFALLSRDADSDAFIDYLYGLEAALQAPLTSLNIPLVLPGFGGIVRFALGADSAADAPRQAAAAVNQALSAQQRWSLYSDSEDAQQRRAFRLLHDVRRAIADGEFELVYQPKHDLPGGACHGAEALLRWHHRELGAISPAEFIPLIETTALIGPLSDWVINTAIARLGAWHAAGHLVKVALNLSAWNFEEPDLVDRLAAACRQHRVDPRYVEIECTEGVWMESADILATLHRIRALGMGLALDDFGTGYSNFSYLQKVPATVVKVDQSLIRHVHTNPRDQRIVRSLIALARELDYQVVAEGVETAQSLALIREWGCDVAQGYHFSKPLAAGAFIDYLVRQRENVAAQMFSSTSKPDA